jgi:tRNA(Ile)-lysidine synthase
MQITPATVSEPALEAAFDAALRRLIYPSAAPVHLAVALSGGADSMALVLLAQAWVRQHGGSLTALTVDHGLRDDSAREAAEVQAWMHARGITHHILTPPHDAVSNNLQEAARTWRYNALAEFCRTYGVLHCLLAHHAGDNRETAALHAARGKTADGGAGMACVRNYRGIRFVRPLLAHSRLTLEHFLRHHAVAWVEDPSNHNPAFARVRMRRMLEKPTANHPALDATIARESNARTQRDMAMAHEAMRIVTIHPCGYAQFSLAAWRALEPTLASQLLADCITSISGATHRPRAQDTARLVAALMGSFSTRNLQHCTIRLRDDHVRIEREVARVASPVTLHGRGELFWDARFHVRYALAAAAPLTLRALGAGGKKQLTQQRIAAPPLATPSLWHLDELLYVPHIYVASANAPNVTLGFSPAKPLAAAPFW